MPRDAALLYPFRPLAPLMQAATVLLLRDTANGLEVLMTRRSMLASFAPGAFVFPGGGIEQDDEEYALNSLLAPVNIGKFATKFIANRDSQSPQHISWALAAIRESFEELGVVLARHADGRWVQQAQIDALDRHAPFYTQMQQQGFQLAANEVFLLAHWITDRDMPKRFEVPFLVARMPEGQIPVADETEQFEPEWVRPQEALARHHAAQFPMIFPTIRTLERLVAYVTVDDVLQACAGEKALWTSCPRAGLMQGKSVRLMEHEAAYGELAMVTPYGQIAHELHWQHSKPVPLLRHVARLTAPNPSLMTGPGTNTYIVGTEETGYIVIDPGADIPAHIERLMQATDGDIQAIVCTHSHADHSPAAYPLQALVVERSNTVPSELAAEFAKHICPILGLPSALTTRENARFEPDIVLQNNEHLSQYLSGRGAQNDIEITLQVIHTPGHAANHLCLILKEDGLLFSGDHILNGSTTVIDPPDGDMSDYLDSLDTLAALCESHDLRFILPAHGYVLSACQVAQTSPSQRGDARSDTSGGAVRAVMALKTHRLKREAKVRAALAAKPGATLQELLPLAYDDVDQKLWPVAARSLAAHMGRIEALGLKSE
jgi:recombination protein RecT